MESDEQPKKETPRSLFADDADLQVVVLVAEHALYLMNFQDIYVRFQPPNKKTWLHPIAWAAWASPQGSWSDSAAEGPNRNLPSRSPHPE